MALATTNWEVTVVILGSDGFQTRRVYEMATPASAADAQTARDALITDLAAATNGSIVETRLSEVQRDASPAAATAPAYQQAFYTLNLATANKRAQFNIPAPDPDLFSGKAVDPTETKWTDFIANFQSGGQFRISDGELVAATSPVSRGYMRYVRSSTTQV